MIPADPQQPPAQSEPHQQQRQLQPQSQLQLQQQRRPQCELSLPSLELDARGDLGSGAENDNADRASGGAEMVVVQNVPASSQPLMTRFQPFDPLAQLQQQPAPLQQQTHRAPEPQQHQPYVQESLFGNPRPFQVPDGGVQSVEVSDQYGSVVNVAVPQRIDQARRAQLEQQQTRDRAIAAAAASGSDGVEPHRIRYRTAEGWTDPMCDCWMYCGLCLCATLLTPWRFAQTSARAQTHPYYASLAAYLPLWAASLTFLIYILFINVRLPVYTWVMGVAFVLGLIWIGSVQRTQLRRKYQIRGTRWEDALAHCCCICCAVAQEAIHVDKECGLELAGDEPDYEV